MTRTAETTASETQGSLRLVSLRQDYRSGESHLLTDFYIPCLKQSRRYYRAVGFFSSSALAAAARGLAHFIKNSGEMFLVASPVLDEPDGKTLIDSWHDPSKFQDAVSRLLMRSLELDQLESLLIKRRLECLAWLLSEKRLQIKIAVPRLEQGLDARSLYHEKLGIFEDDLGDSVAFSGSINETAAGWSRNFESFDVYASWRSEDANRARRKRQVFDALWGNVTPGLKVMDLPDAARDRLIRLRPSTLPETDPEEDEIAARASSPADTSTRPLWPHQQAALAEWAKHDFRGILAMATGTGKTLTAMHALALAPQQVATLILVPTVPLFEQWSAELRKFFPKVEIVECRSQSGEWAPNLSRQLAILRTVGSSANPDSRLIILSTIQTAAGEKFQLCWKDFPAELAQVIADEVHHLGAPTFQNCLSLPSVRRLGLSATPERQWDDPGTAAIVAYFGPTIFEYSVKDAIADGRLCRYEYRPFFAYLDEEEFNEYCRLTAEIDKLVAITSSDPHGKNAAKASTQLQRLLERRALIKKKARDKPSAFRRVLADKPKTPFLIFCEDQEQLSSLRSVLNDADVSFVTYTSEQSPWQRGKTLELFREKTADAILAIRCLDEGVDVPVCESCVIVASSSSTREFIQRRGRVLRISDINKRAIVYDIVVLPVEPRLPGDRAVAERLIRQELQRVNLMVEASEHEWGVRRRIKDELERFGLGSLAFI